MYWPARRQETLLMAAIYRFHPLFSPGGTAPKVCWGDPTRTMAWPGWKVAT